MCRRLPRRLHGCELLLAPRSRADFTCADPYAASAMSSAVTLFSSFIFFAERGRWCGPVSHSLVLATARVRSRLAPAPRAAVCPPAAWCRPPRSNMPMDLASGEQLVRRNGWRRSWLVPGPMTSPPAMLCSRDGAGATCAGAPPSQPVESLDGRHRGSTLECRQRTQPCGCRCYRLPPASCPPDTRVLVRHRRSAHRARRFTCRASAGSSGADRRATSTPSSSLVAAACGSTLLATLPRAGTRECALMRPRMRRAVVLTFSLRLLFLLFLPPTPPPPPFSRLARPQI